MKSFEKKLGGEGGVASDHLCRKRGMQFGVFFFCGFWGIFVCVFWLFGILGEVFGKHFTVRISIAFGYKI